MGRLHRAMARRRASANQLGNAEMGQAGAHPHHINQGIDGPHLMEMNPLGGLAMDLGLSLSQQAKHRQHPLLELGFEGGAGDCGLELRPVAMGGLRFQAAHGQVQTAQAATAPFLKINGVSPGQPQGRQGGVDSYLGQPQIEEGRQQHVAGQARGAIHQGKTHGFGPCWMGPCWKVSC